MPTTITAFYTFYADTTALSSEVNTNFSNLRGSLLPIDPNTVGATTLTYDLGTSEYKWDTLWCQKLSAVRVLGYTTTVDMEFLDANTTTGLYRWMIGSNTLATLTPSLASFALLRVAGATTTANLDFQAQAGVTAGAFDVKIGGVTIGVLDTSGLRVNTLTVYGITSTADLTVEPQAGVTAGAFDFKIGGSTVASLRTTGWKYVTLTVLGLTSTSNLTIEYQAGVTAGAYDFKIGGVTVASLNVSGFNWFIPGPTTTANLTIEAQAGVTAGAFDFKIGGTTATVLETTGFKFFTLSVSGITTTANLTIEPQAGVTAGSFDFKIGGNTAATLDTTGWKYVTITILGITTTTNLIIERQAGVTAGAYDFKIGGTTVASLGQSGWNFFAQGATSTANLTVVGQPAVTAGAFDFKIGSTTIGTLDTSNWLLNGLGLIGATSTANLSFESNGNNFNIKVGSTTIGCLRSDGAAFKKRYSLSGNISEKLATTTVRDITGASVTIETSGFPVMLFLSPSTATGHAYWGAAGGTASANSIGAYIIVVRDAQTLGVLFFGKSEGAGTTAGTPIREYSFPPSVFCFYDFSAAAGTHTYKLQGSAWATLASLVFTNTCLGAMEL